MLRTIFSLGENLLLFIVNLLLWRGGRSDTALATDIAEPPRLAPGDILVGYERALTATAPIAKRVPVVTTASEVGKHILFAGSSGCGKSSGMMHFLAQRIASRLGAVILCRDEQQAHQAVALLAREETPATVADRLLYIDTEGKSVVPINITSGDEEQAFLLMDVLAQYWDAAFGPLVERALRVALMTAIRADLTFGDIPLLFRSAEVRQRTVPLADPMSQQFWREYGGGGDQQRRQTADLALNKLDAFLAVRYFRTALSSPSPLDFRKLFAARPDAVVVVNLAMHRYHGASRLFALLLFTLLQTQLLHPERTRHGTPSIMIFGDESQNLVGSKSQLETCLSESRKYNVSLVLATQVLSRIPADLREVILGNVYCRFVYQSSDAAEFAKEADFGDSVSLSRVQVASHITRQAVGESLLFRRGRQTVPVRHLPPLPEMSRVDRKMVDALIDASNRVYGIPMEEAERQIAERQARLAVPLPPPAMPTQAANEGYEVRRVGPAPRSRARGMEEADA